MPQVVIENPILNSPFEEPTRHFRFSDDGITDEIVASRRVSSYFMPIPAAKKKGKQLAFDTEWTRDRVEENKFINRVRARVAQWRTGCHVGVTKVTARLLEYWTRPDRERKLFFCQIEALETAIYLTEVASKYGDAWIANDLRRFNEDANPLLFRVALKMATGSGKTVVMAMLIAWQALNKLANPQDARFSDAFLIVTPGITIRDRLRVLLPNDPQNYYRQRDILPGEQMDELGKAKILITNFHVFKLRELGEAAKLTKAILNRGGPSPFTETPDRMVRRVCRELGNKKNIIVINDEAHHCYRRRAGGEEPTLKGDERKAAEKRDEEARIWISGLEAVKAKIGIKIVYDLSATPFFLRGSGYSEGTLFSWVVSDFSLIDAIESGIVKVPRVPVADDTMIGDQPTYRDLWLRIRDGLPKKGRGTEAVSGEPKLPAELQGALHSLYGNYEKYYRQWERNTAARANGLTPPVFIVVCNNTNVSKLVFDYVAGWEKPLPNGSTTVVAGQLPIFSNELNGGWSPRPNTILVDSEQLESGEAMSADFKKIAAVEIDEFKADYRTRFPGRDTEQLTDEDLLREVMNTVGKPGKLGENVKCVVSVSMLTEGWDANTVTHILGVRAFGTQLLCEQVVGRGLRRMSYVPGGEGRFEPEVKSWLFPQLLAITRRWLRECVECKDHTFYQLLLLHERAHDAADRIYRAIVESNSGAKTLKPILRPYDTVGSTRYVDFDTTRPTYKTCADKCHVSHVVADTGSWEQKTAQALEEMGEVVAYVKNDHLGFNIPYTLNGEERSYYPDFIARICHPGGDDEINLIVEVTGEKKKDKEAKAATARTLWVPAVNNHGGFGRWAFLEIRDPWNTQTVTREILTAVSAGGRNGGEEATA